MIRYVYTLYSNYHDVARDLDEKLKVEPEFYFLFFTESTFRIYKDVLRYLRNRFPNSKMVGFFVEGYVADGVWTRGLALLTFERSVDVFWARGEDTDETFGRLKEKVGSGWDSAIVIFPLFRFGSRLSILRFAIANNTTWNYRYRRARSLERKREILMEYSKRLERYIYPANRALRFFDFPVIGLNLMPLQARVGTPMMIVNYRDVGRSAVAVCFDKAHASFHDVFPERGKDFDETLEIIKNYFPNVFEVDVVKEGIAVGEVNGVYPVEFLEKVRYIEAYSVENTVSMLKEGKFKTVTPYGIAFISEETFGSSLLGLLPYPIKLYPSLFDLDNFYDKAVFVGEYFKGGIRAFRGLFENKKIKDSFDFFMIDLNTIPMFAGRTLEIKNMAEEFCKDYFGIITSFPSFRGSLNKRHFSEIQNGLCFNGTGTSTMLSLKI